MSSKRIVDLTNGGKCDRCDTEQKCVVCGVGPTVEDPLFYSQSGDHDHLVHYHGQLGREAHGVIMCQVHYDEDLKSFIAQAVV